MKVNPFHLLLWTFRRNENDVVSLYNTLSPMMQLITDNNMLNFGYWTDENITPDQAQNELCDLVGRTAELDTAGTLCNAAEALINRGAKEVHVRIASPEIRYPDFYGVDTPTKKELLAANKSNDEICKYIGAKSLKYLSIEGLYRAMGFESRNNSYPQLTDHYFTGDYPVKPIDNLGDDKITQLSLLSTASNN